MAQRFLDPEGSARQSGGVDFVYRGNLRKAHDKSHSFASYYSAQSSLVGNASMSSKYSSGFRYPTFGFSYRDKPSFQQSPTYYSAESSLALPTGRDVEDKPVNAVSGYLKAVHDRGLLLPLNQELNWSGKENGGQRKYLWSVSLFTHIQV